MIFFKKIQGHVIFSAGPPKRRAFQEGLRWGMIFPVWSGKMVFFSWKHDIFFLGKEPAMTFLCTRVGVTNLVSRPPCQKKSRMALSSKNTPKSDWRSRLTSWEEPQQFPVPSQRPLRAFSCIALQRKKTGNLIYRIEVWLLLQFIWLEIFYNE